MVLGSGGKRLLHALAGGHGPAPFPGGEREARHLQGLDSAAGAVGVFLEPASAPSWCASGVLVSIPYVPSDPTQGLFIPGSISLLAVIGSSCCCSPLKGSQVKSHGQRTSCGVARPLLLATTSCWWRACSPCAAGTLLPPGAQGAGGSAASPSAPPSSTTSAGSSSPFGFPSCWGGPLFRLAPPAGGSRLKVVGRPGC